MSRRHVWMPMFDTDRETRLRQRIDQLADEVARLRVERDRQTNAACYYRRRCNQLRAAVDTRIAKRTVELEHEVARWKGQAAAAHQKATLERQLRLRLTRPKRKEAAA